MLCAQLKSITKYHGGIISGTEKWVGNPLQFFSGPVPGLGQPEGGSTDSDKCDNIKEF